VLVDAERDDSAVGRAGGERSDAGRLSRIAMSKTTTAGASDSM
jgi:hypothetical protein